MKEQTNERDMGSKKGGKIRRQVDMIKQISIGSIKIQAQDKITCSISVSAGIIQGLKYEGSFKRGIKAGVAVYAVIIGSAVVLNLSKNIEAIKNA